MTEISGQKVAHNPTDIALLQFFKSQHLPAHLRAVADPIHDVAIVMIAELPRGDQLTQGLRELLAAKDCFVRAAITPVDADRVSSDA